MKKYFLLITFIILKISTAFSQYLYEFGYWENEKWNKFIKYADTSGHFKIKYSNGKTRYDGFIKEGKPDSTWRYYKRNGNLVIESEYNGQFKRFDDKNRIIELGNYKNGIPVENWIYPDYFYSYIKKKYIREDKIYDTKKQEFHFMTSKIDTVKNTKEDRDKFIEVDSVRFIKKEKFFKNHISPAGYLSIGIGYNDKYNMFNKLNDFIYSNLGQRFNSFDKLYSINFCMRSEDYPIYASIGFHKQPKSSVNLDTMSLELEYMGFIFPSIGYDIIKNELIDIIPQIGFGFESSSLTISKPPKKTNQQGIFNYPTSNEDIVFINNIFSLNFELNTRINIPIGRYRNWGIYIGYKCGYVLSLDNYWTDSDNNEISQIPKIDFNKFRFTFNIGLFNFFQTAF